MKRNRCVVITVFLATAMVILFALNGAADERLALKESLIEGMAELGLVKGSSAMCVLTNAPYVKIKEEAAVTCIDLVQQSTGASISARNFLFYHSAVTAPLRIALFHKGSGDGVVMTHCGGQAGEQRLTGPCSPVAARKRSGKIDKVRLSFAQDKIVEPLSFKDIMERLGAEDAFSIASILNAWALEFPYDFLKVVEFHNHYCPGVTGGYLIAKMVMEKYPLGKDQKYVWIGAPPKCGDDAIQVLLDLTPGKQNCFIKGLTPEQRKRITVEEPLNSVQGILIVWDNTENRGKGLVFKYNWGKACEAAGIKFIDFFPKGGQTDPSFWTSRLKGNMALRQFFDNPSELVSVAKEVQITPEMFVKMISVGSDPYEVAGLTKQ